MSDHWDAPLTRNPDGTYGRPGEPSKSVEQLLAEIEAKYVAKGYKVKGGK